MTRNQEPLELHDALDTAGVRALEWDRMVALAASHARSEPGKEHVEMLSMPEFWARSPEEAEARQAQVDEAARALGASSLWSCLDGRVEVSAILEALGRGSTLEIPHLVEIRRWLSSMDEWARFARDDRTLELRQKAPMLAGVLATIWDPREPLRVLNRVITPTGELDENASPKLRRITQELRSSKLQAQEMADRLLDRFEREGVLQSKFTDVRDGRVLVPLKVSAQGRVEGWVHGFSASHASVFFEPKELEPVNRRVLELANAYQMEVILVLEEASTSIRPFVAEIESGIETLVEWDGIQARARLGSYYGGKRIWVSKNGEWNLDSTTHPLLWQQLAPEAIIHNTVALDADRRVVLLTGPNTGGKTVFLKTLSLAAIALRAGFRFPGREDVKVPYFDQFFTDLGDPQSLERQLSSFSGHMATFREILDRVERGGQTLVILDELNSATDPEEGSALCRAFLESLMERGNVVVVATTHDPALKLWCKQEPRVLSCSFAFDEGSATPTYRLLFGATGRSRALETAERLGLPKALLARARSLVSVAHQAFEKLLGDFEREVVGAREAKAEAENHRLESERLRRELEEQRRTIKRELWDEGREEIRKVVARTQEQAEKMLAKLAEQGMRSKSGSETAAISLFREAADGLRSGLETLVPVAEDLETTPGGFDPDAPLEVGASVRVPSWSSRGRVIDVKQDRVWVELEGKAGLKLELRAKDVERVAERAPAKPVHVTYAFSASVDPQIDVRGQRRDDALRDVEDYLDRAYRSGRISVTVIHGIGTGAIREGVRALVAKLPYVREFRDGGAGAGGTGATLVEFDRG